MFFASAASAPHRTGRYLYRSLAAASAPARTARSCCCECVCARTRQPHALPTGHDGQRDQLLRRCAVWLRRRRRPADRRGELGRLVARKPSGRRRGMRPCECSTAYNMNAQRKAPDARDGCSPFGGIAAAAGGQRPPGTEATVDSMPLWRHGRVSLSVSQPAWAGAYCSTHCSRSTVASHRGWPARS